MIRGTKHMSADLGSARYAGTSDSPRHLPALDGCYLSAGGTNIHFPNHGHVFVVGDALNIHDQSEDGTATLGIYEITAATSDDITITPSAGSGGHYVDAVIGGPWLPGYPATYTDDGNMAVSVGLTVPWHLGAIFCRFDADHENAFSVSLNAREGSAYDVVFHSIESSGSGTDISLIVDTPDMGSLQGWLFQAGDMVDCTWTNPASVEWGLRIIMYPAE
jgi:hypothetical protein